MMALTNSCTADASRARRGAGRRRGALRGWSAALLIALTLRASAQAGAEVQPPSVLKKLSLEELFNLEVTSVSKKPEAISRTAAAVNAVTGDLIRRMGALSIPEALRDIPGVEVARVDARQYAISARGFNGTAANKLLVLMDGRSLYTPLFSGVFWDAQDAFMEDIEQIEVIRGPGATVWGANAVNGVINVITKTPREMEGTSFLMGAGSFGREAIARTAPVRGSMMMIDPLAAP